MSFVSDVLGFESFHLKDMWNKVRKDPERLLLGAVDPASSKLWSKVTGKDYEPIVDQMGGAYGGHTFSAFGAKDGGVYQRAREAGIDTKAGGGMHDAAHVISALFAGNGLAGGFGGGSGGSGSPFGFGESMQAPNFGGTPGFNPMAGGGMSAPTSSFNVGNLMKMGLGMPGMSGGEQQAQSAPSPQRQYPVAPPQAMAQFATTGLGRIGEQMTSDQLMSPDRIRALMAYLQNNASRMT